MSHSIKAKPNFIKSSFGRYVGVASVVTASLFSSMTLASSDILMYDLNADGQLVPESKINITNRAGYDNQPFFSQNGKGLYYTQMSNVMGSDQTDIIYYDFAEGRHTNLTRTIQSSEYSPTEIPNSTLLSVIKVEPDGTQRLWTINQETGQQSILNRHIKPVGYHAWGANGEIAMFVLGEPMTLQIIDSKDNKVAVKIADNIGPSIRYSATLDVFTYSIQTEQGQELWTYQHNTNSPKTTKLTVLPQGAQYYTLFDDQTVISANGSELMTASLNASPSWHRFANLSADCPTSITRIAVAKDQSKIAVVCNEVLSK